MELGGRKVTIQLATASAAPAKAATKAATKTTTKSVEILDEEPLPVPETFVAPTAVENAPEEVKEVLTMFPGELLG